MSCSAGCLGRGSQGIFSTKAGMWGHQEPMTCLRGSPQWPSFSTLPDTALQSATLITWWHTKHFWCKVELTEQQRKGSASRWAAWGIHSRWLQPSQPCGRLSKPALANRESWFVFQEDRHSKQNLIGRGSWHSLSLLLWYYVSKITVLHLCCCSYLYSGVSH